MDPGNVQRGSAYRTKLFRIYHFKTQEMCNKAVEVVPCTLLYVPVHFRMQEVYKKAIEVNSYTLGHVPDHLKTQEMCIKAVEVKPCVRCPRSF